MIKAGNRKHIKCDVIDTAGTKGDLCQLERKHISEYSKKYTLLNRNNFTGTSANDRAEYLRQYRKKKIIDEIKKVAESKPHKKAGQTSCST